MEQTECSETLVYKFQTPVDHPEEIIQPERAVIYLLMKYATFTAKMRNYGQAVVVEEGIIVKLILVNKVK
jgi:hypothetical protein